jgi:uncharacterized membrane protein
MPFDNSKRRRTGAAAVDRQRVITGLKRALMVMLPAWLVYFFTVNLLAQGFDTVTVPYVDLPLGTFLVIQGCALAFPVLLYLMTRAFAVGRT